MVNSKTFSSKIPKYRTYALLIALMMILSSIASASAVIVDLTPDYAKSGALIDVLSWDIYGPPGNTSLSQITFRYNGTNVNDLNYTQFYANDTLLGTVYLVGAVNFYPTYKIPENTKVTITMKFKISDTASHGNIVDGYIENYVLSKPGGSGTDGPADPAGYTIIDNEKPVVVSATADPDPAKNGTVTVTVVFNETMKTSVSPSVNVTGLASSPYAVSQTSYSGDTWVGTFTLLDDDEETTATIAVGLGQDVAGNVMDTNSSAGTFEVDTIDPTVDDIWVSDTMISEADAGGYFLVNVTFSEAMNTAVTPDVSFSPDVETSGTLTFSSDGWSMGDTLYTANYTIADVDEEQDDVSVSVSGAEDLAGNEDPLTETEMFDVDTIAPTVDSASAAPDPAKDGTVTVTVEFSEDMKTSVDPSVNVTGLDDSPYAVAKSSYSGDTWVGTFTLDDDDEEKTATIAVGLGQDLAGNVMVLDSSAGTFEVDTIDPSVTDIDVSQTLINEDDDGDYFYVTVTFDEDMNPSVTPSVSFSPSVSTTLTSPSGAWSSGNTVYTVTYTIDDADVEVEDVNVSVSGGEDPAGNPHALYKETGMFDIDTIAPTVDDIAVSDELINEDDDGDLFYVYVNFSEPMNTAVAPTIDFDPDVTENGTLSFNSGVWDLGDTRYTANYTVADVDEESWDVDVSVSDAEDKAGNEDPLTVYDMFDVDTIAPTVVGFQVSDVMIIEDDAGGWFLVNVTFSEMMNSTVLPSISFSPDVNASGTLTFSSYSWSLGDTRYTANYSVADVNEEEDDVDISVNGGKDLADNTQDPFTASQVIDVDTIAPNITSISWSIDGMPVTIPETNITVTLIGDENYTATFDIVGIGGSSDLATGVSMVQSPLGTYTGNYTVEYGDDGTYLIDGYLEDGAGNIASILGTTNHPCTLYSVGNGTSDWSLDKSHSGSYSVKLYVLNGTEDWAEVSIPVDIALKDINILKFWEYIESYTPKGWSVNILLGVDADNDGDFEADLAAWHQGTTMHTVAVLNGDSFVQMDGATGSPSTGSWSETDALSISQWWTPKNVSGPGFAGSAEYPWTFYGSYADLVNILLPSSTQNSLIPSADSKVKCVKLLIGGSGSWMNETAYVDDLKLNSVIYNLELPFKIDTIPPSVVSVAVSDTLINEADDGDLFNVTVTYSEDMNTSIAPSIVFDPSVNPTLTTPKFGAWISSTVYKYTYTVDDVDEEVLDVDVNVTGAEDLAGKLQVAYSAADKFDVDTKAPPAPTGLDAPDYINIANQSAYPVSGSAESGTTVWVRLRDGSNTVEASGSASGFSIPVDASSLDDGTITIDANATDWAGNTGPYSSNITRTKDTVRPTVASADADPDPTKEGSVTVTVVFSETMKTSVSPTVEVTGLTTDPYAVSEDTYLDDTWNGTFTLFDDDEEATAAISVEDGKDLADNMMLADTTAGSFDVDTEEPTVDLWVSDTWITEADIPGTFLINATFSEPMNTAVTPTIGFDSAAASTLTSPSGSWYSSTIYSVVYTLVDANVTATGIDVYVSGAEDEVGNSQEPDPTTEADMFDIDTQEPTVTGIAVSDDLINEADDGGCFYVYVNFSEQMDPAYTPTICFNPDVCSSGTLTLVSDEWGSGDTRYIANYSIADVDEEQTGCCVNVTGARDLAGNEDPLEVPDMFDVDTIAPTVDDISVSDEWIKEDDIPGEFNVTVEFSEAMNTSVIPDIEFNPDVSSTLENQTGAWSAGDTIYTFTYDIADADVVVEDVNVTVSGAEDAAGNPDPLTEEALFDIDTLHHAGVPEYIDVWAEYSAPMTITLNANEVAWPMEGWYSEWNSPEYALESDDEYAFLTKDTGCFFSDQDVTLRLNFEAPPEELENYSITSVKLKVEQRLISDWYEYTDDTWEFGVGDRYDCTWWWKTWISRPGTVEEHTLSIDITWEKWCFWYWHKLTWNDLRDIAVEITPENDETKSGEWYIDNVWLEINYVYEDEGPSITVPVGGEADVYANVTDWFNDTVPDGTLLNFVTDLGTVYPLTDTTTSGIATTTIISTDVGTATVNASGSLNGICEVTFVATTLDVELSPGWNLISVPRRLENSSIEAVFDGITTVTKVYTYQNGNWTGSAYDGAWSEIISGHPIDDIEDGIGYWVYATEPTTVTISLEPLGYVEVIPPDYELSMGWTMIGYTTLQLEPEMPVPVYLTNLDGTWKSLYRYTPAVGYEQAKPDFGFEYTELGRGYWIYLNEVGVLVP